MSPQGAQEVAEDTGVQVALEFWMKRYQREGLLMGIMNCLVSSVVVVAILAVATQLPVADLLVRFELWQVYLLMKKF
jgi:hypothetical protein